ncbi:MAG: Holliday junction branch migration protein RuvA [Deltaproteobacteria bacterium]|jgi:Holliday junction DNA helicase RuvA|nr:Holliday junction branch migration protein RuvA [Deltaproteobacteria bacterium]
MIDHIRGKILDKSLSGVVVIDTPGGVGYAVTMPASSAAQLPPAGGEASVCTRLVLREESAELFGFLSGQERDAFDILTSVSRVGPRLAVTVLSALDPAGLARALQDQDLPRLAAVKGIGLKTAERIMLELKDKAGKLAATASIPQGPAPGQPGGLPSGLAAEAASALQNMGYTRAEAERALRGLAPPPEAEGDSALESLIRSALKRLSSRRGPEP